VTLFSRIVKKINTYSIWKLLFENRRHCGNTL